LLTDQAPVDREEFVAKLAERGVGSGVYYPKLVHDYDCYRDNPQVVASDVPVASSVAARVVSLPVHPKLSSDDLDTIVAGVRDVMKV
jgi:dTDP-4-amino-4,6-dideoxygalactose transaminase